MNRPIGAVLAAVCAVLVATSPAAALSWNDGAFTGSVGAIAGPGEPEAVCRYDSNARLNIITVKAPIVYGSHDVSTIVGWRYQIRQGVPFHRGPLVYASKTWKGEASISVPSAFATRRFYVTQDMPGTTLYYLRIVIFWYAPGSSTTVEGRAVVLYDGYKLKQRTQSRNGLNDACPFDYSYTETG
ncbi:MAG: hypothetical protein ABI725_02515 [Chloroflexota bacterium]